MIVRGTHSAAETQALGRALSRALNPGDVVSLSGPLGSGKTCLIQGLCQGLGVPEGARSPSFVLLVEHQGRMPVRHVDLYRLSTPQDLDSIGLEDVGDPGGVALVEWGEKAEGRLTYSCRIRLEPEGESDRRVEIAFQDPEREQAFAAQRP